MFITGVQDYTSILNKNLQFMDGFTSKQKQTLMELMYKIDGYGQPNYYISVVEKEVVQITWDGLINNTLYSLIVNIEDLGGLLLEITKTQNGNSVSSTQIDLENEKDWEKILRKVLHDYLINYNYPLRFKEGISMEKERYDLISSQINIYNKLRLLSERKDDEQINQLVGYMKHTLLKLDDVVIDKQQVERRLKFEV